MYNIYMLLFIQMLCCICFWRAIPSQVKQLDKPPRESVLSKAMSLTSFCTWRVEEQGRLTTLTPLQSFPLLPCHQDQHAWLLCSCCCVRSLIYSLLALCTVFLPLLLGVPILSQALGAHASRRWIFAVLEHSNSCHQWFSKTSVNFRS